MKLIGFDTHNSQVQGQSDIQGRHNDLLTELNNAVTSFMDDISNQGFQDDVVGLTFSEFGRKAKENGNLGTDHGEIAPMFVFGSAINGGVSGDNPDLTEASEDNNWQLETFQYDYRQTLGTDHGEIAPMFVFGSAINGGVSGTNPDLTEATAENNFQLETCLLYTSPSPRDIR